MIHPFKGSRPYSDEDICSIKGINELLFGTAPQFTDHFSQVSNFIENKQNKFIQDNELCYYIYRIESKYGCQTGLLALVALDNKLCNIYPHEEIKIDKSRMYGNLLRDKKTQANPIILLHHFLKPIQTLLDNLTGSPPNINIESVAGCNHKVWVIADPSLINIINENYRFINDYYIGDGHHRYYAAKETLCGKEQPYLFSWLISDKQACILPYNWVIPTLGLIDKKTFLKEVNKHFEVAEQLLSIQPENANQLGLYVDKTWYRIQLRQFKAEEHIGIFMQHFLKENFAIENIISTNVEAHKLSDIVDGLSYELAISFPVINVVDLLMYINAGNICPVNTTYFAPKPAIGLVSYSADALINSKACKETIGSIFETS